MAMHAGDIKKVHFDNYQPFILSKMQSFTNLSFLFISMNFYGSMKFPYHKQTGNDYY